MPRYALFKKAIARIFWFISGLPVVAFFLPPYLFLIFVEILDNLIGWLDLKVRPLGWKLYQMYKVQETFRRKIYTRIKEIPEVDND